MGLNLGTHDFSGATVDLPAGSVAVADLANGTDGELLTWDSSGVAATVAVGTATHVLTSNGAGAAPTFQAAAAAPSKMVFSSTMGDDGRHQELTSGTGTTAWSVWGADIDSGATSAGAEALILNMGIADYDEDVFSDNPEVHFGAELTNASTGDGEFGLFCGTVTINGSGIAFTSRYWFGFKGIYSGGTLTLYASNGNNGTETSTDITSGITIGNFLNYYAIYDTDASEIRFYINGTLEATHSTNLPSNAAQTGYYHIGVSNVGTSDVIAMQIGRASYSRDTL